MKLEKSVIAGRLKRLRKAMEVAELDAFFIQDRFNSLYFSGFPCSNSLIVITGDKASFFTDFRYLEKATSDISVFEVRKLTQHTMLEIGAELKSLKPRTLGFEATLAYSEYQKLKAAAGKLKLVESSAVLMPVRAVKEADEISQIAANQKLNEKFLARALKSVRVGMSELELQKGIRLEMLNSGVEEAFETIIASASNSSLPHAHAGNTKVRNGQFLLFDMGVKKNWYHSDMTRTYSAGEKPPSARHREIYSVVLEAQMSALSAVRAGVACSEVDAAARTVIERAGYGDYFGHGLGHGVGLQIHEAPTLNPRSTQVLEEGMVVTIEPGIYVPGFGGVRIEDFVVVTARGCANLTNIPKTLKSVGA